MANRIKTNEVVGLNSMLYFLENDRNFSFLFQRQPSERFIEQCIEQQYKRKFSEKEFITYYKGVLEDYNQRLNTRDEILRYGKTRDEVIKNLGTAILNSAQLLREYRKALEKKAGYEEEGKVKFRRNSRIRLNAINPVLRKLKLEEFDSKYLNLFGGMN